METTEIIAELRKAVAMGDSPVFCGASYIPKRVAMEAADALERQSRRLRELSETALRLGDEIAKQHERTTGDLISRSALLAKVVWEESYMSLNGFEYVRAMDVREAPAVEAEPVVHAHWEFLNDYQSRCSHCRSEVFVNHDDEPPRCERCGAHMDEEVADGT